MSEGAKSIRPKGAGTSPMMWRAMVETQKPSDPRDVRNARTEILGTFQG